ncbi:MAG: heme o synthase [bacterium]
MKSESWLNQALAAEPAAPSLGIWSLYFELGKPRLSTLVVITTFAGFMLAGPEIFHPGLLFWTLVGTACAALGANSFNQWREAALDARMERTRRRPLPMGQLSPRHALMWSWSVSLTGVVILALFVNGLTAFLGALNILIYVLVYTPLKRVSSLCTLAGAVCGAIPPLMGWSAATGGLEYGAWLLAATLFVWQIPHFLSLAWLYREDYARGGFRMLPVTDPSGRVTCPLIVLYTLALVPVGLAFFLGGLSGYFFLFTSFLLGLSFLYLGLRLFWRRTEANARRVFFASLIYLPLFMGFLVIDQSLPSPHARGLQVSEWQAKLEPLG